MFCDRHKSLLSAQLKLRLIAESEQNRQELVTELARLSSELQAVWGRARSLGTMASSAALLWGAFATWRGAKPPDRKTGASWLHALPGIAGLVFDAWRAARPWTSPPPESH